MMQRRLHGPLHGMLLKASSRCDALLTALPRPGLVGVLGLLVAACYVFAYLGHPKLPGNDVSQPLGWWGWFDQSVTLRSTAALARGDLSPSQHHYPLGYSILAVPFFDALPVHGFFFVDLLSLLGAFLGFVTLSRRLELNGTVAAAVFALVLLTDRFVLQQWVVPWSTTPVGAFAWLLFATVAAWLDGLRRPWWIGVLMGAIVVCRPSDAVILLPCLATLLWADRRMRREQLADWAWMIAGGTSVVLPVFGLHWAVYGLNQSPYMASSGQIGFTLFDLGWKAYVLLIDPFAWFADGEGLLQRAPWIALGFAGILPALWHGSKSRLVAAVVVVHAVLYVSYVDLVPTGLWRFSNVHYFAWIMPAYALLAVLLLRDLVGRGLARPGARWIGLASVAGTMLVLCLRVVPVPVAEDRPAKAVDFAGPMPPFIDTFLSGRLALRDQDGVLRDPHDMRAFVVPHGVRVIGMRRHMRGPVEWLPDQAPQGFQGAAPSARWRPGVRLAWPPPWLRRAAPPAIPVPTS